jgi:hypothetical protein
MTNSKLIFVLGATDPEMDAIERILTEHGVPFVHAVDSDGRRVSGPTMYRAEGVDCMLSLLIALMVDGTKVVWVECEDPELDRDIVVDHHRPGDPGFGAPPVEYLEASSIGQVCRILDIEPDDEIRLIAAADHCLGAAYRYECPGVDVEDLMRWRIASKAKHQGRSEEEILADVELAREALREAPRLLILDDGSLALDRDAVEYDPDCYMPLEIADLRQARLCETILVTPFCGGSDVDDSGVGNSRCVMFTGATCGTWDNGGHHVTVTDVIPELPEAAVREGICFMSTGLPGPDGRTKTVCQAGSPAQISAWMEWARREGLTGIYGDPARGFAGGYSEK